MDSKYYLPWGLTVKLALMGYNEESHRLWEKPRSLIKPWKERLRNPNSWSNNNFGRNDPWNTGYVMRERLKLQELMAQGEEKGYNPAQFAYATNHCRLAAVTWEQAKDWLRRTYDVDFYERPHVGKDKKYVCDPLGQGMNNTRLQARETPLEALKCCIEHMCTVLKPLPIPSEEKIQEIEKKEDEDLENPDP